MNVLPYYPLCFFLCFAPLAFGLVEFWSLATAEILVLLIALMACARPWFYREPFPNIPGLLPLVLLAALMAVQILPLPSSVARILSPAAYAYYKPLLAVYPDGAWITLSLNSSGTLRQFLLLVAGILLYVSVILLFAKNLLLRRFIALFVGVATIIAALALIQRAVAPDMLLMMRKTPAGTPFGPWINPSQFAGYIELVAPLALGLCMFYRPRRHRNDSRRERFIHFFSSTGTNKHLFLTAALFIMMLAVTFSMSRGGIISMFCSLLLFQILYLYKKKSRSYLSIAILLVAFGLVFAWVGWESVATEFDQTVDAKGNIRDDRMTLWSDTLRLIGDFPIFGGGFGSYVNTYPLYKTLKNPLIYDHPHNEYLEILSDGGLVGAALVVWFLVVFYRHAWKKIRIRRNRYPILLGIAGLCGVSATLIHGATDFNMHNPAVFLLFYLLCGLTVATVNIQFDMGECETLLASKPVSRNNVYGVAAVLTTMVVALIVCGQSVARHLETKNAKLYVSPQLKKEKLQNLASAWRWSVRLDPLESRYRYQLAGIEWYLGEKDQAMRDFWLAAARNPMEGVYLQRVGYLQPDARIGKRLIIEGARRSLNRTELAAGLAEYLLRTGEQDEAMEIIQKSVAEEPTAWKKWLTLMDGYNFPPETIAALLPPDDASPWFNIGYFRMQNDRVDDAGMYYDRALEIMERHENDTYPEYWYSQINAYYTREGKSKEMLGRSLRQAVRDWPYVSRYRMALADYYLAEGFRSRAIITYRSVLEINPRYPAALAKLKELNANADTP
ncbi:MAG: O-antigen ligase family protein [Desulfobulbaceae bacterium]|jgi:O-antigen ligase/tetratricopeptide (TPR) repeat protein|nr:O-antigen ligase family protein [Desulfobulbaceae bacterium]